MKGIYKSIPILLSLFMLSNAVIGQDCSNVMVEAYGMNPQTGSYNYYGVRVTLAVAHYQDVTVTGYIHRDVDEENNQDHPFTLTVTQGNTIAETYVNFFQTDPVSGASVTVASISTCPGETTATYAGVTITYETVNNIFRFNSKNDLDIVLNKLDEDYDNWNDAYDNNYPGLTAEQMDDVDDATGFDEFYTFRAFENQFPGWTSKRMEIETTEATWLDNYMTGTDPDDIDLTFDDAENAILNSNNSFKIGSDVYQITSEGLYINGGPQAFAKGINRNEDLLTKAEFSASDPLNAYGIMGDGAQPSGPFIADNEIPTLNKPFCEGCQTNKKDKEPYVFGNDKYRIKVAIHALILRSTAKGKVVHFKIKSNGKPKRSRASMAVFCGGELYVNACQDHFSFLLRNPSTNDWKKRRQLKIKWRSSDFIEVIRYKTFTTMLAASFDTQSGHNGGVTLTF